MIRELLKEILLFFFERNSFYFAFCIKKEKKKKKTVTDTVGPKNIRPILDTHFIIRKIVYCRMEKQLDMLIFSVYIYYLILITIV